MQQKKSALQAGVEAYANIAKHLGTAPNSVAMMAEIERLQTEAQRAHNLQQHIDRLLDARNKQAEFYAYSVAGQSVDHLLDTVGALHTRNKGLQKGHATLTRRVQELEAQLAEAQQQILANSSGDFAVVGGKTYIKETVVQDAVISKAQHDLQQDLIALSRRVHALEFAQKPSSHAAMVIGQKSGLEAAENLSKTIEKLAKQALINATKPGGILNGR